jgi:hypothetical protein
MATVNPLYDYRPTTSTYQAGSPLAGLGAAIGSAVGQTQSSQSALEAYLGALSGAGVVRGSTTAAAAGGGGYASTAPASYSLTLPDAEAPFANSTPKPAPLKDGATDAEKAEHWIAQDRYWEDEAKSLLSYYNDAKRRLAQTEMQYPQYSQSQAQSQAVLDARLAVAEAERRYLDAKGKADTINVSIGVTTTKDGDSERVERTYAITDDTGHTVSTRYSEDNGGMSASELRARQQADQQKALDASNAYVQAEAAREVEAVQAGAERDYAVGAAQSSLDAYRQQYARDLGAIDQGYAADRLRTNQDLLMAANETGAGAVRNSREASTLLSQYNLGGSSLGGRLSRIASEAANQSNQVASLTYNQAMREADKGYSDARLTLEDQAADRENAYSQSVAKATGDYLARLGLQAGKNAEGMSRYANADYWYGTMFDAQGNRLNSYADMDSQQMRDYAGAQAAKYKDYLDSYLGQQQAFADQQAATKASPYVSSWASPAAKTYSTGLRSYSPAASGKGLLEREREAQL